MTINELTLLQGLSAQDIELLALAPNDDPGDKYKDNDVLAACPICDRVFWQRAYLVNGHVSPQTCGMSCGQRLRAQHTGDELDLTPRETEVWTLAKQGLSIREIGQHLGISPGTVKNHARIARLKVSAARRGF